MVLGSSLPDRNSKKKTVTEYISVVTAVGQPPTANRTPSAVTANPTAERYYNGLLPNRFATGWAPSAAELLELLL